MSVPAERIDSRLTLDRLLEGLAEAPPLPIGGISSDSRRVRAGDLFLACQGATVHGLDFVERAVAAGAAAVAWDSATGSAADAAVPMVPVPGLATRLGLIANRWFDEPSRAMRVAGVTGTNGKTTVAWLARQALGSLGRRCGYIGTVGHGVSDIDASVAMTTPSCIDLHALLADFRDAGAVAAAVEVSSHALDQARVDGVHFDAAIFTNLTRDHIDYHGNMQAYFEAKAALFLDFDVASRIVCTDTPYGVELAERCGTNVVVVSSRADAAAGGRPHVFVRNVVPEGTGARAAITSSWGDASLYVPLPGDFNVANAAQVLALLLCNDLPLEAACDALARVSPPPGRMQPVVTGRQGLPLVVVDYSHTPDSLEVALRALRSHVRGELWCVFGCGGDRDAGKRPMMGAIANRLSDHAVVTSDNPRTERPGAIIDDILAGMSPGAVAIEDRAVAIAHAIASARPEDTVLIAGKGHENYQVIGERRLDFSDVDVARRCLDARGEAGGE